MQWINSVLAQDDQPVDGNRAVIGEDQWIDVDGLDAIAGPYRKILQSLQRRDKHPARA